MKLLIYNITPLVKSKGNILEFYYGIVIQSNTTQVHLCVLSSLQSGAISGQL